MADSAQRPVVTAKVDADGTAVVTVDGAEHRITASNPDDARAEAMGHIVASVVMPAGAPAPVHLVDQGHEADVVVHLDGFVEDVATSRSRHAAEPSTGPILAAPSPLGPVAFHPDAVAPPVAPRSSGPAASPLGPWSAPTAPPFPGRDGAGTPPGGHRAPGRPGTQPGFAPAPSSLPVYRPFPSQPAPAAPSSFAPPPTLEDLLASRPAPAPGPAQSGWRGALRRISGGTIKMGPGSAELAHRKAVQAVQRSLSGPKTVVVINTKGGGGKTTATYCLAATFGMYRGGYVLAWDDNETRGTLAWRAAQSRHTNTAVSLLRDLERFEDARSARVGDLDNYVRSQGDAQFDVLASDEDAASAASIDATAFGSLHRSLSRFYRIMIIDTGNNIKASNWQAAVEAADQVVIVSSIREDTAGGASWTLDSLMQAGHADKVAGAVTVLSAPSKVADTALADRFEDHFRRRTRAVLRVPYDPALVDGGPISVEALSPATREAWLQVAATIADNL